MPASTEPEAGKESWGALYCNAGVGKSAAQLPLLNGGFYNWIFQRIGSHGMVSQEASVSSYCSLLSVQGHTS